MVTGIGVGSFSMGGTTIPYHRVLLITDRGSVVFQRTKGAGAPLDKS
jgi:uncharacterized protein (UPF0248 family)